MIPTQIYLDMDDVLNAFTMHALNNVGCYCDAFDFDKFKPEWGFDIIKAVNGLHPCADFTLQSFWRMIGRDIWADAPESTEFKWLLEQCEALVRHENICILTTPTEDPECLAGKLEWIHRYCPKWLHRQYFMGPQKYLLARPDALLIDDSDKNVEEFSNPPNGQPGGQVILVPRPWNSLNAFDTKTYLDWTLDEIFGRERAT